MEKRSKLGGNMAKIAAYRLLSYLTLKQELVKSGKVQTLVVSGENRFIKTPFTVCPRMKKEIRGRMIPTFFLSL